MNEELHEETALLPQHPVRWVVAGWLLLSMLFLACWLCDGGPPSFLLSGSAYSLFLMVLSVGLALSGKRLWRFTMLLIVGVITPILVFTIVQLFVLQEFWDLGIFIFWKMGLLAIGLVVVVAAVVSLHGWLAFFRGNSTRGSIPKIPRGSSGDAIHDY